MDFELRGRVALVTGSSSGIGLAIAQCLAGEGARVVLNGRDQDRLSAAIQSMAGAGGIAADVRDPGECERMVGKVLETHGRLDILVCNVGSGASVPPGEETPAEWGRVLDLNLASATNMVAAARAALTESRGAILCVSSICGSAALGAPVTYSAAKAALNAFVRGIARPLGREGVRINAIAPGNVYFEGGTWDRKLRENRVAVEEMLSREVALGRLGALGEIADFSVFLVSPRSSFATGAVFVVDGGQLRS